jgi:hypothetical protein
MAAGGLPDLLTVEEAAVLCRIGRNKAYSLARQWRATNGRCGLPVVEFGHTLRVPRHALEQMLGVTFTAWPVPPEPERAITPPTEASPLDGDRASPQTSAEGPDRAGDGKIVAAGSNVTPIRHRRVRGASDQLPLFQVAGPATESP